MQMAHKKLVPPPSHVVEGAESDRHNRLFVTDADSKLKFLIDTGADISIVPPPANKNKPKPTITGNRLFAANGTPIDIYGSTNLSLNLGLRKKFTWPFTVANVSRAIIGADFLNHFKLAVDLSKNTLIDTETLCKSCISESTKFANILREFIDITRPSPISNTTRVKTTHFITTNGPPVRERPHDD